MAVFKYVLIVLEVLLLFNLLIFVHELGHFLAAKWRGLKIDRFAIWFGKPVWKKRINGIEYALGTIPAGGYVALPQMASMEAIEGKGESSGKPLPPISPLDKIIVAFAGPLFSFLLALGFAVLVWGVGRPVNEEDNTTTIGWVDPTWPAWKAGMRPGDRILAIDGYPVTTYSAPSPESIKWRIITSENPTIAIDFLRDGQEHRIQVTPTHRENKWYERKALRQIGIDCVQRTVVGKVLENSPAASAGLKEGDEILEINHEPIYSPHAVIDTEQRLTNGPVKAVTLTLRRGAEEFERTLQPEKPLKPAGGGPALGIIPWAADTDIKLVRPSPFAQVKESAGQILATLGAVFSRKGEVGVQQLGGPVMIIRLYASLFQNENGWRLVLWWSVVVNVNLAMLNLLPFPVLDGGHILLALIEAVRRRPMSGRVVEYLQTACAVVLITFMLYIMFFDTSDWLRSARQSREEPMVFAPHK